MEIAKYTVGVDYKINSASIRRVDRELNKLEKTLKKLKDKNLNRLNLNIANFTVDQRRLNMVIGNALDRASQMTTFQISRFVVDQNHLNRTVATAMTRAMHAAPNHINMTGHVRTVGGRTVVNEGGIRSRHAIGAGGAAGVASRFYGPALALAGGGYGLAQLNRRNQEVVSAQLQTQAVVQQAGGTVQEGQQSFDWLRAQGNRIGFNYLEAAPDYNNLVSGLTGAGMSLQQSQGVYKGFAELARTNKLDRTRQNRLFRALAQVAGKDKLMSEELRGQIAEALPGGVSLFAEAYQRQVGGNLTGGKAIQALNDAMKKGQVKGDILTFAAQIAGQRAAPTLAVASKASQAEQGRFQNAVSDTAILASNNGVEEGFARIFRTLSTGLNESNGLVRTLADGFNKATVEAEKLLLFPQSFQRALEGRDSLVADWLGVDATKQLREDWTQIKILWDQIAGMQTPEWMPTLKSTAQEIAGILNQIAKFQQWKAETGSASRQIIEDEYNASGGTVWGNVKGLAKANWYNFTSMFGNDDTNANYWMQREQSQGYDTAAMYGNDPRAWRDASKARNEQTAKEVLGGQGYGISQPVNQNNDIKIDISVQAENTEGMENWFKTSFQKTLEEALPSFTEKE